MKQRLCLARCMIHDPKLLILDEPASGLDPRARYEFKEIIRQLRKEGRTIMISSHILSDLSEMCTNICIIDEGRCVMEGSVDEIEYHMITASPLVIRTAGRQEDAIRLIRQNEWWRRFLIMKMRFRQSLRVNGKMRLCCFMN